MTNNNHSIRNGSLANAAGRLSMISILAITAGLAAAPAQAQTTIDPAVMPMQSPVAVPQPAPAPAPATQSTPVKPGPVKVAPVTRAETTPPVTADRADALATKGGFDAETVAPEALAQIEREQQARKEAAAKSAAAAKAAAARTTVARGSSTSANSGPDSIAVAPAAPTVATAEPAQVTGFDSAPAVIEPTPETAVAPADLPGDTDWTLLAALAGLLGIGGVGAYVATRRRKSKVKPVMAAQVAHESEPKSAAVAAATMPELRRERVEADVGPSAQPAEQRVEAKSHLTDFIAGLPSFEEPRSKADRHMTIGERRVAAAPRPYLGEADLARHSGYFVAHVDAAPTPQNPFLTRQKRLKRAQYLDARLAEMKAAAAIDPNRVSGTMQATRPKAPAYS